MGSGSGSTSGQSGNPGSSGSSGSTGSGSGSTYGQSGSTGSSGSSGSMGSGSGSTYGQSGNTGSSGSGSTYGQSGNSGSSGVSGGSASGSGSSDSANLRTVTGSVAKVDQNSITLDQSAGGVTLTVDSQTQVTRRGQPIAAGISAIHEGQQIRASFDPASNRADKIEMVGRGAKRGNSNRKGTTSGNNTSDTGSTTNPK